MPCFGYRQTAYRRKAAQGHKDLMMAGLNTDLDGFVRLPNRGLLRLSGEDRLKFLQGLVSNDVNAAAPGHALYSCMLTPQGKFLHDFFLIVDGDSLLIECEADRRAD